MPPFASASATLDRDDRHARNHATCFRLIDHALHIIGTERRAARRQRDERQRAERLRAVAFVLIEMALLLDDDAARSAGERSHCQVIGERAGGHEDGALLSKHARALVLELVDDAAERIGVRSEARRL